MRWGKPFIHLISEGAAQELWQINNKASSEMKHFTEESRFTRSPVMRTDGPVGVAIHALEAVG